MDDIKKIILVLSGPLVIIGMMIVIFAGNDLF